MIDEEVHPPGVNVWISFADLFAGLLLIMLMGLVLVVNEYKNRSVENIRFSNNLVRVMNKATEINKQMQHELNNRLPDTNARKQFSETQIVIPAEALFVSFGFDPVPSGLELLTAVRQALHDALDKSGSERSFLRIIIEGHTDSDPIKPSAVTTAIRTNWELSGRRATGVLRFFEEGGLTAREYNIVAMGLADTVPIAPNNTDEEKSRNRRIVIRIEPDLDKIRASL